MGLGLGQLRLPTAQFWAMTPKEIEAAVSGFAEGNENQPMARADMDELLKNFPDEVENG